MNFNGKKTKKMLKDGKYKEKSVLLQTKVRK